jgi:hypothetical protein
MEEDLILIALRVRTSSYYEFVILQADAFRGCKSTKFLVVKRHLKSRNSSSAFTLWIYQAKTSTSYSQIPSISRVLLSITCCQLAFICRSAWISRTSQVFWCYLSLIILFSFHYLLENEKLLLVLVDREKVSIYLARPAALEAAIRGNPLKTLNRDKLGLGRDSDVFFAFDEAKRMLAVCSSVKVVRSRSSNVVVLTCNYQ